MHSRSVAVWSAVALVAWAGRGLAAQGRGQDARPGIAVMPLASINWSAA